MQDIYPVEPFTCQVNGEISLPGSKSITNRALVIGALGSGVQYLKGPLFSEDTQLMLTALKQLGFKIQENPETSSISIEGKNGQIPNKSSEIFVGNAGTVARFLVALVSLKDNGHYYFDGSPAMRLRPMWGLLDALENLNAIQVSYFGQPGCMPFSIKTKGIQGGSIPIDAETTSQYVSALLLAGSKAYRNLDVKLVGKQVSTPYIHMTKRMLNDVIPAHPYYIEGDASTASYFLGLLGLLGGHLTVNNFPPLNGLQGDASFLNILGLNCNYSEKKLIINSHEKIKLRPTYDMTHISDTFPTLAAMAPLCGADLTITGIKHTRNKETNRIDAVAQELKKLGQNVIVNQDSLVIEPNKLIENVEIDTYNDHRIAMAFAMLGSFDLLKNGKSWMKIKNPSCCNKTFPQYFNTLERLRDDSHHGRRSSLRKINNC